jgi:hypothetical protein
MTAVHVSPYPGAGPDWPLFAFCDRAPVAVSARRDGAFGSALFCADCSPRARAGDPAVVARVPER